MTGVQLRAQGRARNGIARYEKTTAAARMAKH